MSDRDAFIQSILANPADDTVRLIFADWLDENGVASDRIRANFIRRQVAGMCRSVPLTMTVELEPYLGGRPGHGWLENYGYTGGSRLRYREGEFAYRRGFVDEIRCPLNVFLEHAEELFRGHPITRVVITDWRPVEGFRSRTWGTFTRIDPDGRLADPKEFTEEAEAVTALSAACVAYGRERAGLPPLETAAPGRPEVVCHSTTMRQWVNSDGPIVAEVEATVSDTRGHCFYVGEVLPEVVLGIPGEGSMRLFDVVVTAWHQPSGKLGLRSMRHGYRRADFRPLFRV